MKWQVKLKKIYRAAGNSALYWVWWNLGSEDHQEAGAPEEDTPAFSKRLKDCV